MKTIFISVFLLFTVFLAFAQDGPQGLALHSKAPNFNAKDQNGKNITLKALRSNGPVVVLLYRGNWCPYCNKQLNELQDSLQYITAKGAQVVAITPEASN
jgi:peroxiredoxin